MIQEDCFAFVDSSYWLEDEYFVKRISCKALTELVCKDKTCPFYKKKGTEREVIFHAKRVENAD